MIWNKEKECMSRDELMDLQGKKLVTQVNYMYQNVMYYREKMRNLGLEPGDIQGIEDLNKLPYTTRGDICAKERLINFPIEGIDDTEQAENCTANDIRLREECIARFLSMAGLNKDDIVQMTYNGDMARDRQGVKYGIEKIGVKVISDFVCNIKEFISVMEKRGITSIMCTPTYLRRVADISKELGHTEKFCLKASICSGEALNENVRRNMETILSGKVYDTYSLNGASGFGVASECECQNGMHIQEDLFLAEVYHEEGKKIFNKNQGELVLTTLEEGGCPLMRYRTEDIVSLNYEKCACGRTNIRMTRIESGEKDFMIRGKEVMRFQIEEALIGLNAVETGYIVRINKEHNMDVVEVIIEFDGQDKTNQAQGEENIKRNVEKVMEDVIGMIPRVSIADKDIVSQFGDKKVTVLDLRNLA